MERKLFHVQGIDCGGSERIIEAQLEALDGVEFVHADAGTGTIAMTSTEEALGSARQLTRSLGYRFENARSSSDSDEQRSWN
ncbi:MAG: heavy-metal-associated domain-containing protein [Halolamina sp.]